MQLLQKAYFDPGKDTMEKRSLEVLALFSSPTVFPDGEPIMAPLQLMRELMQLQHAVPAHRREIRPAACFPRDVEAALGHFLPRVLQFSGHTHHITQSLIFEMRGGVLTQPPAEDFIELLRPERAPRRTEGRAAGCGMEIRSRWQRRARGRASERPIVAAR